MNNQDCVHCGGNKYVLVYQAEKYLKSLNISMEDILFGASVLKIDIPHELFCYCHCNMGMPLFPKQQHKMCDSCKGTTWIFSEFARVRGYGWRSPITLSGEEINELSCEYFERCNCAISDSSPLTQNIKEQLKYLISALRTLPGLSSL